MTGTSDNCKSSIQLETTKQISMRVGWEKPDIPHILINYWFKPLLYFDPVSKFPETLESLDTL
jgi:hypothetical protein